MIKNWKTTLAGALVLGLGIAHQVWPTVFTPEVIGAVSTLLVAVGFMTAKDNNVTGGTTKQ
jgi:hypothetical protein